MLFQVMAVSYLVCAGAYIVAIGLILAGRTPHRYKYLLIGACAVTAAWAACIGLSAVLTTPPLLLALGVTILEQARAAAWIAVASFALFVVCNRRARSPLGFGLAAIVLGAMAYNIAVTYFGLHGIGAPALAMRGVYLSNVVLAIVALLLIENLFRNSGRETRWATKYLCFGLGLSFSYDFFVFTQASLLGDVDATIYAARGIVQAIAMPLIVLSVVRSAIWPAGVQVSRKFVFHTATLLSAGAYLLIMAAAGYSLRVLDSAWGIVVQVSFLMASLLLLVIVLSSGEAQARLRSFINQNFFTYKYDYRVEWLRFIEEISGSGTSLRIPERVIQALANIIGSTGAKIWIKGDADQMYRPAASWNMHGVACDVPAADPWLEALAGCPDVIDLRSGSVAPGKVLPDWLAAQTKSLILLPLVHKESLIGFVTLGELRAPRPFHWEDFQLLKIAARQAASYIAEENATQALEQVRRFEDFNQRFAFIVHDVKNLAAQMTLILKNAERHGDNPQFQKDVLKTVGESAGRLRSMLEQLKDPAAVAPAPSAIDLVGLLRDVAATWKLQVPKLAADLPDGPLYTVGEREQLRAVVGHLIQNAADAIGHDGIVSLELHVEGVDRGSTEGHGASAKAWAVITVADDGPGMDGVFVENNLFRPLNSPKSTGFGIGVFQARQVARDMGGRLDVESETGRGTRMTVRLPYVGPPDKAHGWTAAKQTETFIHALRSA